MRAYARRVRRGRGCLGQRRPAARLRLRAPSHPRPAAPGRRPRCCATHGYPEWFVRAIQSHGDHTGFRARDAARAHALRLRRGCRGSSTPAASCGRRGLATLEARSVRKKLKQPSFARGVNRDDVIEGAGELGVDLDEQHHLRDRRIAADRRRARPAWLIQPEIQVPWSYGDRSSRGDRGVVRDRRRGRRSGSVRPAGNKNAALPILAACLLTAEPVTLDNVPAHPRRRDDARAARATSAPRSSGRRPTTVRVWAADVTRRPSSTPSCATRIRASILLAGPLLARFGAPTSRRPAAT